VKMARVIKFKNWAVSVDFQVSSDKSTIPIKITFSIDHSTDSAFNFFFLPIIRLVGQHP
jgi:hypothetical protein